jgi:D-alanyl-D-alanine carboxypeptidase
MSYNRSVENILMQEIVSRKTPSAQYIIFSKEDILYKFQNGLADIKHHVNISDKTTYHALSVTKTFTALAILQLAERGMLTIDEPVTKYLPELPYPGDITIRQLLTHSAGIPNPIPLNWIHLAQEHYRFNEKAFFSKIFAKHADVKSKPNQKYAYSNLGYVILGFLIERISGISYESFVRENILDKVDLHLHEIDFTTHNLEFSAKGYHKRLSLSNLILGLFIDRAKYMAESEGSWRAFRDFYVNGLSYGGLIGTPYGFVKYIRELLNPHCSLLSDKFKRMLFTENIANSGRNTGMCLSWFKGKLNGTDYFSHAGGGGGYYCEIRIYPALDLGSVIFFNRSGITDERFLDKVDKYFIE